MCRRSHGRLRQQRACTWRAKSRQHPHVATVIDIGKSTLHDSMNEQGFCNDVIRLGGRLVSEQVCDKDAVDELFKVIAEIAWSDAEDRQRWHQKMLARQRPPA